jgi:hypothetical protein
VRVRVKGRVRKTRRRREEERERGRRGKRRKKKLGKAKTGERAQRGARDMGKENWMRGALTPRDETLARSATVVALRGEGTPPPGK